MLTPPLGCSLVFCMYVFMYILSSSRSLLFSPFIPCLRFLFPQGFYWSSPQLVRSRFEFALEVQGAVSPLLPGFILEEIDISNSSVFFPEQGVVLVSFWTGPLSP